MWEFLPHVYLQWHWHTMFKVAKQGHVLSLVFYIDLVTKNCKIKPQHRCFKSKEHGNEKMTGSTIFFLCSFRTPGYLLTVLASAVPGISSNMIARSKPAKDLSPSQDTRSLVLVYKQGLLSEFILIIYTLHWYMYSVQLLFKLYINFSLFCSSVLFSSATIKGGCKQTHYWKNMPTEKKQEQVCALSQITDHGLLTKRCHQKALGKVHHASQILSCNMAFEINSCF